MFDDRNKPFYKLFDKIKLMRIKQDDYTKFLQAKAKNRWKKSLPEAVLMEVYALTENHAYYFNRLCDELWQLKKIPTLIDVKHCWQQVIENEFDNIAEDLSFLAKNQRLVLQAMASHQYVNEPSGKAFVLEAGLSHASILTAIKALDKIDLIERTQQGYRIIDPALKFILNR